MKKKNIFIVILTCLCLININFAFADGMWDVEGWDPYSSNSTLSTTTDNQNDNHESGKSNMTTQQFDRGMAKGIEYFNKGMYVEAVDEFTWFRDYNYEKMNPGQQKYLDEYLYDAKWYAEQEKKQESANKYKNMSVDEFCDYVDDYLKRSDVTSRLLHRMVEHSEDVLNGDSILGLFY